MRTREPTTLHRKSGIWGTHSSSWGLILWTSERFDQALRNRVEGIGLIGVGSLFFLVEHHGYFVGGEALSGIGGVASAYGGFVKFAGGDFLLQSIR